MKAYKRAVIPLHKEVIREPVLLLILGHPSTIRFSSWSIYRTQIDGVVE